MFSRATWKTWAQGLIRQNPRPKADMTLLRPVDHDTGDNDQILLYHARWFFSCCIHISMNFSGLKCAILVPLHGCQGNRTVAMEWLLRDTNEQLSCKPEYLLYRIKWYWVKNILVAVENFEKCTVAMLGGPCHAKHVTAKSTQKCYDEPTKHAVVAKDSNISHYLNSSINSPTIILPII